MRYCDLDLEAGVWLVPTEWAKSKREMAIPLTDEAVRILKARRVNCQQLEWVWPSGSSRGRASVTNHVVNPEKPWRRILKSAGVKEHATLHDVRRTLGSRLAMDGVAGATISKVLGHVSSQSLKHYAHLDVTAGREAVENALASVINVTSKDPLYRAHRSRVRLLAEVRTLPMTPISPQNMQRHCSILHRVNCQIGECSGEGHHS
jgi:integrase